MKLKGKGTKFYLSPSEIDRCAEVMTEFLIELKTEKREILRLRLSVEEILLKWQEHFGDEKQVSISCFSYFGQPTIQLILEGEPFDPLKTEDETYGEWSRKLLSGLQATPLYSYSRNSNAVTFKLLRKRLNPLLLLLAAFLLAAAAGVAGMAIPSGIKTGIAENVLAPVCSTYINVISFCGIPLIFLSVMLGICGIGDASSFGQIGKKMVGHFMLSLSVISLAAAAIGYPFYHFTYGAGTVKIAYGDFLDMILGFLPTNLLTPFIDCNAMQLIIMGVVFGIAILKLEPKASGIHGMFEELNGILLLVSEWMTRILPFFVFAIVVKSIWAGDASKVIPLGKTWVLVTAVQLFFLMFLFFQICLKNKVSIRMTMRKTWATFVIALGTNSCCASIPEIFNATSRLGVNQQMMLFGIPIGTSVFKPACAIRLIVLSYFFADFYDVGVSVQWFVMTVIMAIVLSIAVPAIPGGVFIFYPMLLSQLGIPAEAINVMLAVDVLFDAPCTAFCQVFAELALVQQAGKMDLLDKDALADGIHL